MTTITDLSQVLNSWIRRLRLQRAVMWALRGFILGLAVSLALGSIGLYRAELLREEFLTLVIFAPLLICLISALTAFFWRLPPLEAARRFDRLFRLGERVSTALELHQLHLDAPTEMIERQLQDALAASTTVDAPRHLSLRPRLREGFLALLLILLICAVWLRGDRWFEAARQARGVEQAVAEQTTKIEEIIKQIDSREALSEQQKRALTAPLKEAQQNLRENPSLENSVSTLTSTGEKLQALSDPQSQQMSKGLKEAGNQLAGQEGSPLQEVGQDLAQGDYVSAASRLQNIAVNELSQAEQQQLADQLQAMADALGSTNPGLASELRQAADALRSGDTASAQQALDRAAQSLAQAGQQITFSQTASQTASQMQQGAGQVLAAGGGQQQANQAGQGTGSGQGSNQSGQTNGTDGSGAGRGSGTGESQTGDEAGAAPIQQNNGPGDGGETSYEQIYAPRLLGGEGGPQVGLPDADGEGGDVIGEGPTTPGDPGTSLVPYSEVYSEYERVNNRAIENGEVPAQFTQIIKNYFDSLEP
ncbi:MAG: hypothetical protein JW730_15485 [Anaerolineales bacterium]|nr:hypothetical protein [Anaerolineales bacterium]